MKLSELRVCDSCRGPLLAPGGGITFRVVRVSMAVVSPRAAREVMGLSMMFGGALGLAEAMAPEADAVKILADHGTPWTELFLCQDCYCTRDANLASLVEMRDRAKAPAVGDEATA